MKLANLWKLPCQHDTIVYHLPYIYEELWSAIFSSFHAGFCRAGSFWTLSYTSPMKFLLGLIAGCLFAPWIHSHLCAIQQNKLKNQYISLLYSNRHSIMLRYILYSDLYWKLAKLWKLPSWNNWILYFLPFTAVGQLWSTALKNFQVSFHTAGSFRILSYTFPMEFLLGKHTISCRAFLCMRAP